MSPADGSVLIVAVAAEPLDGLADRAYAALARQDEVLGALIGRAGRPDPFDWDGGAATGGDLFAGLALHLVGQQISTAAAFTIYRRIADASGARPLSAPAVARIGADRLRAAGLSQAKARALDELARAVSVGTMNLDALRATDDASATRQLTALRGIGPWSAQMFLIHQLHRPDVFPAGDVGLRIAMQRCWQLPARPSEAEVASRAEAWAPFRTYAAALLWASLRLGVRD